MPKPSLLLSLDDSSLESELSKLADFSHFNVAYVNDTSDWVDQIETHAPDVAVIEVLSFTENDFVRLSEMELLHDCDLVLISSGEPNEYLDQLMHLGALFHYRKPVDVTILAQTLDEVRLFYSHRSDRGRKVSTSDLDQFGLLVGSSMPMHRLYRTLRRVARTEANVLIVGESGAGKELVAQTIHLASERSQEPFIAINCGAISPELVDSELFGHEKGAFTGANKTHQGVFKQAQGGTLFLDEVTEMPIEHQVKLLRVLESSEYRPIGSQTTQIADVRIIAATNRDPQVAIDEQHLREDLYFRLAQFPVNVPPLRERGEDIVGLAKHFIAHRNASDAQSKTILDSALAKIQSHNWPGNVRELKHTIERAFILADDVIKDEHLVFDTPPLQTGTELEELVPTGVALDEIERAVIVSTLERNNGNKTKSADDLGISVKTLYNKLEKYDAKEDNA